LRAKLRQGYLIGEVTEPAERDRPTVMKRKQAAERAAAAQARYARTRRWVIKPSLALGLLPAG